ncbi:hypothetical protein LCGC14_0361880 [marine sediment metagenome]|uniref:Thoeris anti-defense 2-like domain-containing protein n=1 Tax=marine sediment metagenome TaxID=412755 RepID=A0A0F9T7M1_9ZZZZ
MEEKLKYIGTKIIHAQPINLGNYNEYRCWDIPKDEDPAREGYLVTYQDGYESWSPKDVFDAAYRRCDAMTFGLALEAVKKGLKVARAGWNGKGIFIYIPAEIGEMTNPYIAINTTGLQTDNAAAPKCVVPWLASQTDMLAEDWMIVE